MKVFSFSSLSSPRRTVPPITLEKVRIAAPCPARWEQMTGDDRVRHCAECKLNVYNLSDMTRKEAERLIDSREGRLCVRFYHRADGTIITRNCPRGLRMLGQRISRTAGAVLSVMMSVGAAFAQTAQQNNQQQASQKSTGKHGPDCS